MSTKATVALVLLMLVNFLPFLSCLTTCSTEYRSLNGECSNLASPGWGRTGAVLSPADKVDATVLSSRLLADKPSRSEPVTDWLAAWAALVKSDLVDARLTSHGLVNFATQVLDLSNLYGVDNNNWMNFNQHSTSHLEIGERTLLKLLEAEHRRVVKELSRRNHGWGSNKINQVARSIVIATYQNVVINELLPLLIGQPLAEQIQKMTNVTVAERLSPQLLLSGTQAYLTMATSDLEILGGEPWTTVAAAMLNQRLTIPGGGLTLDRLGDASDALDTLGYVPVLTWARVRQNCGLQGGNGVKHQEAVFRTGQKENEFIDALVGGLAEEPEEGAILSPTLACLLKKVVEVVVIGDRFWFQKDSSGLSPAQLRSVQTTSLAGLLCANLPDLRYVQPSAFLVGDGEAGLNSAVPCTSLASLDLDLWTSPNHVYLDNEMDEVETAVALATNKLLEFRRFEYALYEENYVAPRMSSSRASGSVLKPSIKVMNKVNDSALFELVTYEFLRSPSLEPLVKAKLGAASALSRRKRSPRTFDIIIEDVDSNGLNNVVFNSIVKSSLKSLPHDRNFYRLTTSSEAKPPTRTVKQGRVTTSPAAAAGARPLTVVAVADKCTPSEDESPCRAYSRYRSYSGYCNNLARPSWGESNSHHRRFLPSEYDDGISKPRSLSVLGSRLPNPRTVSLRIHTHEPQPDPKYTLMMMQWGQFIDHDLTHTPAIRGHANTILQCNSCTSSLIHPACLPIPVPSEDNFYTYNRVDPKCIPFTRSMPGQQRLGPREQLNQLSSYLDASMVYGSDECMAKKLRVPGSFLMATYEHPLNGRRGATHKNLPPRTRENMECFSASGECFLAGDSRVNEHPGLAVMHTLMVREHNEIASWLARLNPQWSTTSVFEETRRIIAAQIQHITYNEFLPRVLGRQSIKAFELELSVSDYYRDYDDSCSATSFNEFATAAFRFGHSVIRPNLTVLTESAMMGHGGQPRYLPLRKHFNNPDVMMDEHMVDDLTRGLVMTPMESVDNRVTEEVANHLFEEVDKPKSGMDLVAINIQRGRDHGIPGYNKYREMCKLTRANKFADFKDEIKQEIIAKMEKLYAHPDDVDLFTGLLSETKLAGALTGPTLACLIGLQFSHIRRCDRFWYETDDPDLRFTRAQLDQIKTVSLASLLCKNMDQNNMIPRSSFDQMDRLTNPLVDCKETIKHLDLAAWKVDPTFDKHSTCQVSGTSVLLNEWYRKSPCTTCQCTAQGLKCETINLWQSGSSCLELVNEWGIRPVEEDPTCRPQCKII